MRGVLGWNKASKSSSHSQSFFEQCRIIESVIRRASVSSRKHRCRQWYATGTTNTVTDDKTARVVGTENSVTGSEDANVIGDTNTVEDTNGVNIVGNDNKVTKSYPWQVEQDMKPALILVF